MKILFEKQDDFSKVLVAKLISDTETLYNKISKKINEEELSAFHSIKNEKRKKEWLGVRILFDQMVDNYEQIKYDKYGRPYPEGEEYISISHSNGLVALIVSKIPKPGIDIELVSEKIARVALKFLTKEEVDECDESEKIKHIYLNWCGKETLYKIHSKGNLNFVENLKIKHSKIKDEGILKSTIITNEISSEYSLNYKFLKPEENKDQFLLVWHSGIN